jgi:hypothetical protein
MMDNIGADETYLSKVYFSNYYTFHLSGNVNRQNVRGSENPHDIDLRIRDSRK